MIKKANPHKASLLHRFLLTIRTNTSRVFLIDDKEASGFIPHNMNTYTQTNFSEDVLKADLPVIVIFKASWCEPCHNFFDIAINIEKKGAGKYYIGTVDTDDEPELCQKYAIQSIPTTLIFKHSEIIGQLIGVVKEDDIFHILEKKNSH